MNKFGCNDYRDYLAHHGIVGMKWGDRNGPPYPLAPGDHSAAEKKAGWRSSLSYEGAGGNKKVNSHITNVNTLYRPAKGFKLKLKSYKTDLDKDLKAVNPRGYTKNCMNCTVAWELRKRGYDVEARQSAAGFGSDYNKKMFPKAKTYTLMPTSKKEADRFLDENQRRAASPKGNVELKREVEKTLTRQGEGARGNLMLQFTKTSGHSVAYEVKNGKLQITDGQKGIQYTQKQADDILKRSINAEYCRLDNLDVDEQSALYAVRNKNIFSRR